MRGRPDCPHCQGSGFLLDPDPMRPARICPCTKEARPELATLQLPARYRETTFAAFFKWWSKEYAPNQVTRILTGMEELKAALAAPDQLHLRPPPPLVGSGPAGREERRWRSCQGRGTSVKESYGQL